MAVYDTKEIFYLSKQLDEATAFWHRNKCSSREYVVFSPLQYRYLA